jgi:hypothetical protein
VQRPDFFTPFQLFRVRVNDQTRLAARAQGAHNRREDAMGLFSKSEKKKKAEEPFEPTWPPQDPKWARTPKGRFYNLITFDPAAAGLEGTSGVFVVWHGGVKPHWVYVGCSENLASAIDAVLDDEDILSYHRRGGLFVTWSTIRSGYQAGVVRYLQAVMKPKVENPDIDTNAKPVSVRVPGASGDDDQTAPVVSV